MKELNQTSYLLQIKNNMLFYFHHADISSTLKDIKLFLTQEGNMENQNLIYV